MASFKILKLRSKKVRFPFPQLPFFFSSSSLQVLTPTQLAILNSGKENLWASCSFSGNKAYMKHLPHFLLVSSGKWRSTSLMLSLSLTHSVTFKVWMENSFCPYLPNFTEIPGFFLPPISPVCLSFSFHRSVWNSSCSI